MAIIYEVTAKNGTYKKDGKDKTLYCKMGVVMESKNGPILKIEQIPVGWDGWAYLNEPRDRQNSGGGGSGGYANEPAFDPNSDIPFLRGPSIYDARV